MVTIFVLFLIGEAILWDSLNLSPPAALVWGKYVMNCPKNSWLHFLFSMQKSAMKFLGRKWHPSLPPGDFLQNHPIWRVQVSQYKLRHANIVYCFVTMWNLWWKSEWHACHGSVLRGDAVAVAMVRYISFTNSLWLVKRGMEQYHRKLNITKRGTQILKQWHETNGFRMTRLCVVHCTDIILKMVLTSVVCRLQGFISCQHAVDSVEQMNLRKRGEEMVLLTQSSPQSLGWISPRNLAYPSLKILLVWDPET